MPTSEGVAREDMLVAPDSAAKNEALAPVKERPAVVEESAIEKPLTVVAEGAPGNVQQNAALSKKAEILAPKAEERKEGERQIEECVIYVLKGDKYVSEGTSAKRITMFVEGDCVYPTKKHAEDGQGGVPFVEFNPHPEESWSKTEKTVSPNELKSLEDLRAKTDPEFAEKIKRERSWLTRGKKLWHSN